MKVFQIGANGGIGSRLTTLLVERGDTAAGMHRAAPQSEAIEARGGIPVPGDLIADSVDELAAKMAGSDAVVFAAGAHGTGSDPTPLIDGRGRAKAAEAAQQAGIRDFILVSVFPDAGRGRGVSESFEHYMRVKKTADVYLTATDLDWIIVRPGTLLDEPGDGKVTAGLAIEYGDVRRDNVAAFVDELLHSDAPKRVIIELTDGDTPVADAVRALA